MNWDLIIMLLALFNCFSVPVEMAFEPDFLKLPIIVVLNYMIDFVFLIDILINFRTAYIDEFGMEQTRGFMMATNYLRNTFIIDILATVPFDTILRASPQYIRYVQQARRNGERQWI